jgi:hypothetical protein
VSQDVKETHKEGRSKSLKLSQLVLVEIRTGSGYKGKEALGRARKNFQIGGHDVKG